MRNKIYVLSHGNQWKVQCEHCETGIYNTQADAINVARRHVSSLAAGTLAQILVQRDSGAWREEWTYGRDPFPPRG